MNVAPGSRLGPYEILSRAGAGGMGEVWKARDTRLERHVAIKILPADFANDAQLRLRFEREAKTISQLGHPNICAVFDVGDEYMVMEYLEGETLADRLSRGALPVADVLKIGVQIANALEKAHRAGVVHRDLKPGNIMILKSGAKLLDFGLARSKPTQAAATTDVTQHKPLTQEGTIVGTWQYMSPEQLAGDEADARSDIFSFGAVLYEMLTGQRAFEGKTKTSLVAAILGAEPRPIAQLQPMTPPALEHVITKCLAKEPDDRWQSAADIASELEWISRPTQTAVAPVVRARNRSMLAALAVMTLIAIGAIVSAILVSQKLARAELPIRSELVMPEGVLLAPVVFGPIALSPDGTRLAFVAGTRTDRVICVRNVLTGETKELPGTKAASYPFWSPGGDEIGFFADGKLKTASLSGAGVQVLCDATQGRGASWSTAGVIVFTPTLTGGLYKVSDGGGNPVQITRPPQGWSQRNPSFLRDGEHFLFTGRNSGEMAAASIYAASIHDAAQQLVVENASNAVVSNGWLLFTRNRNLVAMRFDERTRKVSGAPIALADEIDYYNPRDSANFSASPSMLAFVHAVQRPAQITSFDETGKEIHTYGQPGAYDIVSVSPDERKVAVSVREGGETDLWLLDLERETMTRSTFVKAADLSCAFSPDGTKMAVASSAAGGRRTVWIQSLDGRMREDIIKDARSAIGVFSWTKDNRYLVVGEQHAETALDVELLDLADHTLKPLVHSPFNEVSPSLSPDEKWLAYFAAESSAAQVYVTSFPTAAGRWQVSTGNGAFPRWSPDGRKLYFIGDLQNRLMAVDFRSGVAPEFGTPQPVQVSVPAPLTGAPVPNYVPMSGGRIIVAKRTGDETRVPVSLVMNWTKLLPH